MKKKTLGLGRGLSSLFEEPYNINEGQEKEQRMESFNGNEKDQPKIYNVLIENIIAGPFQPRKEFHEEEIQNLSRSIQKQGILQPLIVRPKEDKTKGMYYEIIAGERRWRAAQLIGLKELPVLIKNLGNREGLEVALIENIQREDLSPLEEAEAYARLIEELEYTQETLAEVIGKSRSHIANMLRLLNLPFPIKKLVQEKKISAGHARALVNQAEAETIAGLVIKKGLSVRQLEDYLRRKNSFSEIAKQSKKGDVKKSSEVENLEEALSYQIGLKTELYLSNEGKGKIIVYIQKLEDLDDFFQKVLQKVDPVIVSEE